MKDVKKEYLWALGLLGAGLLLWMLMGPAEAGGRHVTINNYYTTEVTEVIEWQDSGVTPRDLSAAVAAIMAADAIHCSTSTRKHQAGIGTGYHDGKNGFALGYCKSVDTGGTPVVVGGKAFMANGMKPGYSLGLNWTF